MPRYHESTMSQLMKTKMQSFENKSVEVDYDKNIDHILSIVLARSTQMLFFETQVNNLLDSAEKIRHFAAERASINLY